MDVILRVEMHKVDDFSNVFSMQFILIQRTVHNTVIIKVPKFNNIVHYIISRIWTTVAGVDILG